jgi:O-antigen/teichoic acid export membrane protein
MSSQTEAQLAFPAESARTAAVVRGLRYRVAAGGLWSAMSWILGLMLGIPMTVLLVRTMTPRQYGVLAVATTITTIGVAVAGLGLSAAVSQAAASARFEHGAIGVALAARSGMKIAIRVAAVLCVLSPLLVLFLRRASTLHATAVVVAVLLPTVIVSPIGGVFRGVLQALFEAKKTTIANLIGFGATVVLTVLAIVAGRQSALDIGIARSIGGLAGTAAVLWAAGSWLVRTRDARAHPHPPPPLLGFAVAMLLNTIVWTAISQLDVFFVGVVLGPSRAGLYAPASRLADFAVALAALIGTYLLPALTMARAEGSSSVGDLYHWSSRWSFTLASPLLALMLVSPSAVLTVLFGQRFAGLDTPTQILGLGATIHILFGFNGLTLEAHGLPRPVAIRSGAGLLVSVTACPLLIPWLGLTGAALATLTAIVTVNVLSSWPLLRHFGIWPWDRALSLTAIAFAAALGLVVVTASLLHLSGLPRCAITASLAILVTVAVSVAVGDRAEAKRLLAGARQRMARRQRADTSRVEEESR